MARGTHTQTTDIDIPVTFHQPLGFFKFMDLKDLSENLLKSPIDLVTQYALHPRLRDQILKESIHVI